jgi:two-component system, chemotaxis family, response regulator Rcp1
MADASGSNNPRLEKDRSSVSRSPTGESSSHPLFILLVEDNEADAFLVDQVLRRGGFAYELHVSPDGAEAVRFLENLEHDAECPDIALVLLDLNLPKIHGVQVLERIRKSRRCSAVPVVILTSSDSPADLAAIHRLNATAYFKKPADVAAYMQLSVVIEQALA